MKRGTPAADPDSPKSAYFRALRLLTARDLSESQVRDRLERRGYTRAAIDSAVARLLEERTLDDRRTALAVARTAARVKRHGPRRVQGKLLAIGIDRELAKEVLRDLFGEVDEEELLERALDRRLHGRHELLAKPEERRRLLAYLVRQGFSASAAASLLRRKSK